MDRGATWSNEWAAEKAAEALRYLGRHYPECLEAREVLDDHEQAAHEAAVAGDADAYLEALRGYCRAGRRVAMRARLRARKGAAWARAKCWQSSTGWPSASSTGRSV